jgi:ligand-binding sensor domain-containing protein
MAFRVHLSVLFFTVVIGASAQYTHAPYRQYTLRDGLSQMQVICMFQDSRDYIWIGTKGGINRFNGDEITSYNVNDGLASDYIFDIAEDSTGSIWMSTGKGLACFDGKKITAFPSEIHNSLKIAPTPDGKIWYVSQNTDGNDFFGYFFNGKYYSQTEKLSQISKIQTPKIAYSEENKAILVTNENSVFEFRQGKTKRLLIENNAQFLMKQVNNKIFCISFENPGNFKLYEYNRDQLKEVAKVENNKLSGENRLTEPVTFSSDQADFPIIEVTPDTFFFKNIHGLQKNQYLIDNNNNQLWLGSEEGLYQIYNSGFETYKKEFLPQVWSVTEDTKGNMWFASFHFGLKKFNGKTFQSFPELDRNNIARIFFFHPSVDNKGRLFFSNGLGLLAFDGKNFSNIKNSKPSLTSFYDTEKGYVWSGVSKGVEIYDQNLNRVKTIGEPEGMEIRSFVVTIAKDNREDFWFGSLSGLSRYTWESGKLVNYNRNNKKLPADGILSIFTDYQGCTWFASTHGLLRYNAEKDSVIQLANENLMEMASFVTAIDSSWLIVSQPYGIYLMDLQTYHKTGEIILHLFNEKNGLLGIEPGQDGAFTDSKGNIWLTTSTEVVKINPKLLNLHNNKLQARFSGFNGKELLYNQNLLNLPRNERSAVLTFDAICFNRPNKVEYSWKIVGKETEWSAWQRENYAVLSNLSNGITEIQLRVKVPGLSIQEVATDSIGLKVKLAVWRQAWFFPALFGIFASVALFTLFILVRLRIKMADTKRQAKVFQVEAIQSQMNPHFIFNVLASFQTMILSANVEKANNYLVKLAALIRGFLDSSSVSSAGNNDEKGQSLQKEMEMLAGFVGFQQLIYPEKFEYFVEVDPQIDMKKETIPPMLLQPFVENSIRHGLLLKKGKGILRISIHRLERNGLNISISDDGIGIEKAAQTIRNSPFRYVSKGSELTLKRVKLLNELGLPITIQTTSSEKGTSIEIKILSHEQ